MSHGHVSRTRIKIKMIQLLILISWHKKIRSIWLALDALDTLDIGCLITFFVLPVIYLSCLIVPLIPRFSLVLKLVCLETAWNWCLLFSFLEGVFAPLLSCRSLLILLLFKHMKGWWRSIHCESDTGLPSGSPMCVHCDYTPRTPKAGWDKLWHTSPWWTCCQVGTSTPSTGGESFMVQHLSPHVQLGKVQRQLWLIPWDSGVQQMVCTESKSSLFSHPNVITDFRGQAKHRFQTCDVPLETIAPPKNIYIKITWRSLEEFILTSEAPTI